MWTGSSALKNIDVTLQSVRREVVRLDNELADLTNNLAVQQRRRVKILNDIAAVRLLEIEQGTLSQSLSAADQEAAAVLEQRQVAIDELNTDIETLNQQVVFAEQQRAQLLLEVNAASAAIVAAETDVQAELKSNAAYLAQLQASRDIESIANEAAQKVADAQADMAKKAQPYQKDSLFTYLWDRGYGTTEYKAGLFARFMDGWVARVVDYEPARVNYWNLTEIPKRLQQHADAVANEADEAVMALQQIELDALAKAGVPEQETSLQVLRNKLDQHDDVLEENEFKLNAQLAARATYLAGEDQYIRQCLKILTEAMNHQSLRSIHRYVQVTHSPTDDELVLELQDLETDVTSIDQHVADLRRSHGKQLNRLKEIEEVRRNFKNSRFDDVRSGFNNESLLASVLAQFVQGVVSGSDVWRVIKRSQQYRDVGSLPDFGSGGFGNMGDVLGSGSTGRNRRQRNSSWHWPKPRKGGGGFNFPRRGGGGGGFKTGGGF